MLNFFFIINFKIKRIIVYLNKFFKKVVFFDLGVFMFIIKELIIDRVVFIKIIFILLDGSIKVVVYVLIVI